MVTVAEVAEVVADEEGAVDGADVEGLGARVPFPRAAEGCGGALWRATRASDLAVLAFARVASVAEVEGGREDVDCGGVNPAGGVPADFAAFLLLLWDSTNCVSSRSSVHV